MSKVGKISKGGDLIAVNVDPCREGLGRGLHVFQHGMELSYTFHKVVLDILRDKGVDALPADKRVEVRFTGVIKAEEIADAVKASVGSVA